MRVVILVLLPLVLMTSVGAEGSAYTHSSTLNTGLLVARSFNDYDFAVASGDRVTVVVDWQAAPGSSLGLKAGMGAREQNGCRLNDLPCVLGQVEQFPQKFSPCGLADAYGVGSKGQLTLDVVAPHDGRLEVTVGAGVSSGPISYTISIQQNGQGPENVRLFGSTGFGAGIAVTAACTSLP